MGISKKGKRTIIYQEKEYVWWVREDEEYSMAPWLTIASPDKSLILTYPVEGSNFFVISKGRMFQGRETSGKWEYYWYPFGKQTPSQGITPGFVRELVAWAVDGREAVMISGKRPITGLLYLLVLCDEELSYDNHKEEFCIGIFSSHEKAEAVAKHYLRNVDGFKDYCCSYRIVKKKVFGVGICGEDNDKKGRGGGAEKGYSEGNDTGKEAVGGKNCSTKHNHYGKSSCTASDKVYMVYGWNENEEGDEVNIVESDCFTGELEAKQGMVMMKQTYVRTEWCISCFYVDEWHWKEGFVRM